MIGFGALLSCVVGGNSPQLASANPGLAAIVKGAIGLPAGLAMVILTGSELFTDNVFVMLSGFLSKRVSMEKLAKNWLWSFAGNFAGALCLVYMSFLAKTTASSALSASVIQLAVAKVNMGFVTLFTKGILCNWLVCLAVWMAMAAQTAPGESGQLSDL